MATPSSRSRSSRPSTRGTMSTHQPPLPAVDPVEMAVFRKRARIIEEQVRAFEHLPGMHADVTLSPTQQSMAAFRPFTSQSRVKLKPAMTPVRSTGTLEPMSSVDSTSSVVPPAFQWQSEDAEILRQWRRSASPQEAGDELVRAVHNLLGYRDSCVLQNKPSTSSSTSLTAPSFLSAPPPDAIQLQVTQVDPHGSSGSRPLSRSDLARRSKMVPLGTQPPRLPVVLDDKHQRMAHSNSVEEPPGMDGSDVTFMPQQRLEPLAAEDSKASDDLLHSMSVALLQNTTRSGTFDDQGFHAQTSPQPDLVVKSAGRFWVRHMLRSYDTNTSLEGRLRVQQLSAYLADAIATLHKSCDVRGLTAHERLVQERQIYDGVLTDLTAQVTAICSNHGHLLAKVAAHYREAMRVLPDLLQTKNETIDSMTITQDTLQRQLQEAQTQLATFSHEETALREELEATRKRLAARGHEVASVRRLLQTCSRAEAQAIADAQDMNIARIRLISQVDERHESANRQMEQLLLANTQLRKQAEISLSRAVELEATTATAVSEATIMKDELAKLRQVAAELTQETNSQQKELASVKAELQAVSKKCEAEEQGKDAAVLQLQDLMEKYEDMKRTSAKLAPLKRSKSRLDDPGNSPPPASPPAQDNGPGSKFALEMQLAAATAQIKVLTKQVDRGKSDVGAAATQLNQAEAKAKKAASDHEAAIKAMQAKLDAANAQTAQAQAQIQQLQKELSTVVASVPPQAQTKNAKQLLAPPTTTTVTAGAASIRAPTQTTEPSGPGGYSRARRSSMSVKASGQLAMRRLVVIRDAHRQTSATATKMLQEFADAMGDMEVTLLKALARRAGQPDLQEPTQPTLGTKAKRAAARNKRGVVARAQQLRVDLGLLRNDALNHRTYMTECFQVLSSKLALFCAADAQARSRGRTVVDETQATQLQDMLHKLHTTESRLKLVEQASPKPGASAPSQSQSAASQPHAAPAAAAVPRVAATQAAAALGTPRVVPAANAATTASTSGSVQKPIVQTSSPVLAGSTGPNLLAKQPSMSAKLLAAATAGVAPLERTPTAASSPTELGSPVQPANIAVTRPTALNLAGPQATRPGPSSINTSIELQPASNSDAMPEPTTPLPKLDFAVVPGGNASEVVHALTDRMALLDKRVALLETALKWQRAKGKIGKLSQSGSVSGGLGEGSESGFSGSPHSFGGEGLDGAVEFVDAPGFHGAHHRSTTTGAGYGGTGTDSRFWSRNREPMEADDWPVVRDIWNIGGISAVSADRAAAAASAAASLAVSGATAQLPEDFQGKGELKSIVWLLRMCRALWQDKWTAEGLDYENGIQPAPMAVFMREWFAVRYGVKQLVEQTCRDMLCSLAVFRAHSLEIDVFYRSLVRYESDDVTFVLHIREAIYQLIGDTVLPSTATAGEIIAPRLLTLGQAVGVAVRAFEPSSSLTDVLVKLVEYSCPNLPEDHPLQQCIAGLQPHLSKLRAGDTDQEADAALLKELPRLHKLLAPLADRRFLDAQRLVHVCLLAYRHIKYFVRMRLRDWFVAQKRVKANGLVEMAAFTDACGAAVPQWNHGEASFAFKSAQTDPAGRLPNELKALVHIDVLLAHAGRTFGCLSILPRLRGMNVNQDACMITMRSRLQMLLDATRASMPHVVSKLHPVLAHLLYMATVLHGVGNNVTDVLSDTHTMDILPAAAHHARKERHGLLSMLEGLEKPLDARLINSRGGATSQEAIPAVGIDAHRLLTGDRGASPPRVPKLRMSPTAAAMMDVGEVEPAAMPDEPEYLPQLGVNMPLADPRRRHDRPGTGTATAAFSPTFKSLDAFGHSESPSLQAFRPTTGQLRKPQTHPDQPRQVPQPDVDLTLTGAPVGPRPGSRDETESPIEYDPAHMPAGLMSPFPASPTDESMSSPFVDGLSRTFELSTLQSPLTSPTTSPSRRDRIGAGTSTVAVRQVRQEPDIEIMANNK